MEQIGGLSLAEAVTRFLSALKSQGSQEGQRELLKFMRWCGKERSIAELTAHEIEEFAGGVDAPTKLATIKAFLAYAQKEGLTKSNLAVHAKAKRVSGGSRSNGAKKAQVESIQLTAEGYEKAVVELEKLKGQRIQVAEELRRAMADKDFRENAPLDAARERQGQMEARIRELEAILRHAEVMHQTAVRGKGTVATLGSKIVVKDLYTTEELAYTLVNPSEASPIQGKISVASPAGKAFMNKGAGEVVEVVAPAGIIKYKIEKVEARPES